MNRQPCAGLQLLQLVFVALTLLLPGCDQGDNSSATANHNTARILPTTEAFPYRANSRFAEVLKDCALLERYQDACTLTTLPFLGNGVDSPSIESILDRVLVTHDWMGQRFEAVLRAAPADMRQLFSSVTAVVIGSEVRPSYYSDWNGAIGLAPEYLWLTRAEKRTVSLRPDFRFEYGQDLLFREYRLWHRNGQDAFPFFALDDDTERSFDEMVLPVTSLLYHELTHANDFMPRNQLASLDQSLQAYDAIYGSEFSWIHEQIEQTLPLNQTELFDLGRVLFLGESATDEQNSLRADYVGSLMANDGAVRLYSYANVREDIANLVEVSMMSKHYGVTLNVSFVDEPVNPTSCADYIVGWGERNRLANPQVASRAQWVTERILGSSAEWNTFFSSGLGPLGAMEPGLDWCTNQQSAPAAVASRERSFTEMARLQQPHVVHDDVLGR